MIKSGIFNSVNGDRRYKAEDFASYFAMFISNGVFPNPSNCFQVFANDDMTVTLKPGKAWIFGYYATNDADYNIPVDVADGVLNRIDRIVLQLNYLNREIVPVIKKGTFASNPVAPNLKRDADAYEIALADVFIGKGVLSITQPNITDLRLNTELCGIVHCPVNQVDTTTIFNQYQAWLTEIQNSTTSDLNNFKTVSEREFNTWFDSVKGILSGDVAGNLANRIGTHEADYVKHPGFAVATGTSNNYFVALNPSPTSYVDGMGISVAINIDSTGASTININGLGAKPILKSNGNAVSNLKANGVYTVRYNSVANGGTGAFILQGEGGEYGTAMADEVLAGYTLGMENGVVGGKLTLTGTATSDYVASGKTFYNTDAKSKLTGTGAKVKLEAEGSTGLTIGNYVGSVTYNISLNLDFTPRVIIIRIPALRSGKSTVGLFIKDGVAYSHISDESSYYVYKHIINSFSSTTVNITSSVYGMGNNIYLTPGTYTVEYYAFS